MLTCRRTNQLGDEGLCSGGNKMNSIFITAEKLLSSDEFHVALARVASLGINYGVEKGLRMGHTNVEFEAAIQKVSNFHVGAKADFDKALVDFPTTPFPFLNKIVAASRVLMKLRNKCLLDHASDGLAASI
ncbi:hypothetical protein Tco_1179057 [Tanacetum coccineum]